MPAKRKFMSKEEEEEFNKVKRAKNTESQRRSREKRKQLLKATQEASADEKAQDVFVEEADEIMVVDNQSTVGIKKMGPEIVVIDDSEEEEVVVIEEEKNECKQGNVCVLENVKNDQPVDSIALDNGGLSNSDTGIAQGNNVQTENGLLFVDYTQVLGNRYIELANPGVNGICTQFASLEKSQVDELFGDPSIWIDLPCLSVRLLQLVHDDPSQIGLVSPVYFDQIWHEQLFKNDPRSAFLTKPEFNDLILAPIYQNRNHFTLAVLKKKGNAVKVLFCDSFKHDPSHFVKSCLNKIVREVYDQDVVCTMEIIKECDLQLDGCNCAAFVASNAECFLRTGHFIAYHEDGYFKRWNLRNDLAPLLNMPLMSYDEMIEIMGVFIGVDNSQTTASLTGREKRLKQMREYSAKRRTNETREEREERLKQDREYKKVVRENETEEEREERLKQVRENMAILRENETEEEREERLKQVRENMAILRENETEEEREERLKMDKEYKASVRVNETDSQKTERLDKQKATTADNRQRAKNSQIVARKPFFCIAGRSPEKVVEHRLSSMNIECSACEALHFKEERVNGKKTFDMCCGHGKVELEPLPVFPKRLKALFMDESKYSDAFFKDIMYYNNEFSFATLNAKHRKFTTAGPYCYSIQGQINYKVDTNADDGNLLFVDLGEAVEQRGTNNKNLDKDLLGILEKVIRKHHVDAQCYMQLGEQFKQQQAQGLPVQDVRLEFKMKPKYDAKKFLKPTCDDIALICTTNSMGLVDPKKVVVKKLGSKTLERIHWTSPKVEPWLYPLFFPSGTFGWTTDMLKKPAKTSKTQKETRLTRRDYLRYRFSVRDGEFNPLLRGKKLTQKLFVCSWVRTESDRLQWLKDNQNTIKADSYKALNEYLAKKSTQTGMTIGKVVILPSTFIGSPRYMIQNYQDAMAIVLNTGKPDLFITATCSPKCPDILENLYDDQTASDRPDIVARVFKLKVDQLIHEIKNLEIFGPVASYVYVVEFQMRGLPHVHLLVSLKDGKKFSRSEIVDQYICAELPDSNLDPVLFEIVSSKMIHGKCGPLNDKAPCMRGGKCSKRYPKEFRNETEMDENGYPLYRRRDDGRKVVFRGFEYDNTRVVPYNPYLSKRFDMHINVEVTVSIKSIKYLHKYIYKGHDHSTVEMSSTDTITHNEITDYVEGRVVGPVEAAYRILSLPLHDKSHTVLRLPVHLPDEQQVYYDPSEDDETLESLSEKKTMLMEFFALNRREPEARKYFYPEIPKHFVFGDVEVTDSKTGVKKKVKMWKTRKQHWNTIGRMYAISPAQGDLYYLRMLLSNVRGPTSYEDLRTVDDVVHPSFASACLALGLVEDDDEYRKCLEEAANSVFPKNLRILFVNILIYCNPTKPEELWELFKEKLSEDYMRRVGLNKERAELKAYKRIELLLRREGRSLADYPSMIQLDQYEEEVSAIDYANAAKIGREMYGTLNDDQKKIVNLILASIGVQNVPKCFFLDGPGGSGKTYVYTAIYYIIVGMMKKVVTCAFTGIAATLLPGGRTCHKVFGLPVPLTYESFSNLKTQSHEAKVLMEADVIILDEGPMAPRYVIEIADKLLRDLMKNNDLFGGKIVLIGGDFRQLLPVKRNAIRSEVVDLSICSSKLWPFFTKYSLTKNMRVKPNEIKFAKFLQGVGDGTLNDENDRIELPDECITDKPLSEEIFKDAIDDEDYDSMAGSVILSAKHVGVNEINDQVLDMLPGNVVEYISTNTILENDEGKAEMAKNGDNAFVHLPEYLSTIEDGSLPPHKLRLKKNAVVILIRNLSNEEGLCNGTRMLVLDLKPHTVACKILTGSRKGEVHWIPRINNTSDQQFFTINRKQFPLKLAFSMTINKSQGGTFERVGIDLQYEVFSHGHLYVALSRARSWDSVKVNLGIGVTDNKVKNIIFKELYDKLQ